MYNKVMNSTLCPDSIPSFLNFFDLSIAPGLLYYTYIPAILVALFLIFFIHYEGEKNRAANALSLICLSFALWTLDIFILWIAAYNDAIMFGWQLTPIFEVSIFIFSLYFVYLITDKKKRDIDPRLKIFFLFIATVVFLILPTDWNIHYYDISICEGVPGAFWDIMYAGEMLIIAWIFGLCLTRFRELPKKDAFRKEIAFIGTGVISFLILFTGSNIVGQITGIQQISFIGSLGMVIFLGFLAFLMVQYKIFHTKLFATQALVVGTAILIWSQLLLSIDLTHFYMVAATLIAFLVSGVFLIRSVKKEIKQREELAASAIALRESNKRELEKAMSVAKLKDEFVFVAAHELRTPITAIKGFLELVSEAEGNFPTDVQTDLDSIKMASNHLNELVNNLLEIARSDANGMKIETKPMALLPVVKEVVNEIMPLALEKKIKLSIEDSEDKDVRIMADELKVKEILMNLIGNAVKYGRNSGFVKVGLSCQNDLLMIEISDNGYGIPKDDQGKIFGKFFRATNRETRSVLGTGLGLFITRMLTEKMGGKIDFTSVEGEGTTFAVSFPAAVSGVNCEAK